MNRLRYFSLFSRTLAPSRFPRRHDAVLRVSMFPYSSAATVVSAGSNAGQHMFMAQYLVESCGFKQEKASDVSKLLSGIKSRQQPDSVLAFFKSYGFHDRTVTSIIGFFPQCLLLNVEKSLAPKFQLMQDLGLSRSDVAYLIRSNPIVLKSKFETIVPEIRFWKRILGSNDSLVKLFELNEWFLGYEKRGLPYLECGLDGQKMASIKFQPVPVWHKIDSFKNSGFTWVFRVHPEGVWQPSDSEMVSWVLHTLSIIKPNKFEMQMELFRGFGWSEDDFIAAFQKCPTFPTRSLKALQRKMEFFVNEAGYASSQVAMCPGLLRYSLEKRLIPRFQVLTVLKSRGYCKTDGDSLSYIIISEKRFLKKYVRRYKKCPDLIEFYASLKKQRCS